MDQHTQVPWVTSYIPGRRPQLSTYATKAPHTSHSCVLLNRPGPAQAHISCHGPQLGIMLDLGPQRQHRIARRHGRRNEDLPTRHAGRAKEPHTHTAASAEAAQPRMLLSERPQIRHDGC
jgi:hypothetical protein